MPIASATTPRPTNEPVGSYREGSPERALLKTALAKMVSEPVDVAMSIGGREVRTGKTLPIRSPHDHGLSLGTFHEGDASHATSAIELALAARPAWAALSQNERSAIFLKAAELAATTHRQRLNAATMLGQSKTAYQAEIDAACELIDFLRFNADWAGRLLEQPEAAPNVWNALEARPLDGFVCAITPFNFTAIAGNLPSAPALLGNVVVWKPSPLAMRSAHELMCLFREAGLPDGVINLIQGPAEPLVNTCLEHPRLGGVHFTGSTAVFRSIWQKVGSNVARYKAYPRLVGETGGKDFVFAHASADLDALAVALVRGAFEYQGQKCSAASRAYVPRSIWAQVKERVVAHLDAIKLGDVRDFRNFMGAVIDERAFVRLSAVLDEAKSSAAYSIVAGGRADRSQGWFIHPTVVESREPDARLMREEFFGPVLTVWVYEDSHVDEALALCDGSSDYALTGAVFARDRAFVHKAHLALREAAGNFYVNDKPTGAVVGQQPFGGGRASGTNDKAGCALNLMRWVSPRAVKETFVAATEVGYPFMSSE